MMTPAEYDALCCALRTSTPAPCWPVALLRGNGPPDDPEWPTPATPAAAVDLLMRLSPMLAGEALLSALYLIYPFTGGPPPEGSFPRVGWLIKEAGQIPEAERRRQSELVLQHLLAAITIRTQAQQGFSSVPIVTEGEMDTLRAQRRHRPDARLQILALAALQFRFLAAWWRMVRRRFAFSRVETSEPDESSLRGRGSREERNQREVVFNGRRDEPSAAALNRLPVIPVPPLPSRNQPGRNRRGRTPAGWRGR